MDVLRISSLLFGIVFLFIGIAGFMPNMLQDDLLFGIFKVDHMHNTIHVVTGIVALLAALQTRYARIFFQLFGIIYAIVAVLGFVNGEIMGMPVNTADNFLHIVIAVVAFYLGFIYRRQP